MNLITETRRLSIEMFTCNDTDLLYQLTGDEHVMRFFPKALNVQETGQMLDKILRDYKEQGYCFWKLLKKADGDFAGIAGLLHQEIQGAAEAEVSYRIKRQFWNHGYATEAAGACKAYGMNQLGKKRLISLIRPDNIASKRVAEKLGARESGLVDFEDAVHVLYVYMA